MSDSAALVPIPRDDENVVEAVEKFLGTSVSRTTAKKVMFGGLCVAALGAVMVLKSAADEDERYRLEAENEANAREQLLERLGHKLDPRTCRLTYYQHWGGHVAICCGCGVKIAVPDEVPKPE